MKTLKLIAASAIVIAIAASCKTNAAENAANGGADSTAVAQAPAKAPSIKSLKPKKSQIDSVSYLLGINFGSFLKGYNFGEDFNYGLMKKGIEDFLNAKGDYRDSNYTKQFKINPEELNDVFNAFLAKRGDYIKAVNYKKSSEFLAKNAQNADVTVSESGLQYTILEAGNEVKPGEKDTVYVNYKGTLTDGTVFDQSPESQKEEGVRMFCNRVVKGFAEGLQLLGEGGKAKLYIPAELGYGERGTQGIEPNSVIVFDVELVKVKPYVEPEPVEEDTTK